MTPANDDESAQHRDGEVTALFGALRDGTAKPKERRWARERLVELHLGLVRYLASRFAGRSMPMDDLTQVGALGLLKAIDGFDPARGTEFVSYAAPTILGEIKRHLRDTGWLLNVPRRAKELHTAVQTAREELSQELGRSPSVAEIAERIDASTEEVTECLDVVRSQTAKPLDALIDPGHHADDQRFVAQQDDGFDAVETRTVLSQALEALSEEERRIVRWRFVDDLTQQEIAALAGVSQMQVSRLLSRSFKRMRAVLDDGDREVATARFDSDV